MRITNIFWSLTGLIIPLGIAALTVPQLLEQMGTERFGILALSWGLIGYAGVLDLGIGRALNLSISKQIGAKEIHKIPDLIRTSLDITLYSGLIGGLLLAIFALMDGYRFIKVENISWDEIKYSVLLLALVLPAQAISAVYRNINEAFSEFKSINILRIALGAINFGGPFILIHFTNFLPYHICFLVLTRFIALVISKIIADRCLQNFGLNLSESSFEKASAKSLLKFGSWATVSSLIGPIITQIDRYFIAALISASAVTYYTIPLEITTQSLFIVTAISSVMFPALSSSINQENSNWKKVFNKWLAVVLLLMLASMSALYYIFPWILSSWLGPNLPATSATIGKILCLGVVISSIGGMYFTLIQARGRSDVTALVHLVKLPIFVAALYYSIDHFGITGAAWAWVIAKTFESLSLIISNKFIAS